MFLLLSACGEGEQFVTRDQAIDIADDAVDASELSGRIDDLEAQIAELEKHHGIDNRYMVQADNAARTNDAWQEEATERLFYNDRLYLRELNRMRAREGLAPIPEPDWGSSD